MKKWRGYLPGGKQIVFESDSPREYLENMGYSEYALEQVVPGISDCPVDRGKLLIGLECCRMDDINKCRACPYDNEDCVYAGHLSEDALAYISYLEERLGAESHHAD